MIDPRRLARAIHLDLECLSGTRWLVSGGTQAHVVENGGEVCNCWDARGGRVCKHRLRVYLDSLAPEILTALRQVVAHPGKRSVSVTSGGSA